MTREVEERMNRVLETLGVPLKACWTPDPSQKNHGNIDLTHGLIHIHDEGEQEAWQTLLHEVLELKLRRITNLYQGLVNSLITFIENEVYREKENFLSQIPLILKEVEKESEKT